MLRYFATLSPGKTVLWCYLLWYLVVLGFYFDPTPRLWLTSAGISVVIGFALMLSVSTATPTKMDRWQLFRLFAMPFCVSSFSSLIKGQGFWLVIPPHANQISIAVGTCLLFVGVVSALNSYYSREQSIGGRPQLYPVKAC
jgi:hypothetical protein